jgi:Lrp/AsnC family transcriptional regulator, leucine-responsive regulatory protein
MELSEKERQVVSAMNLQADMPLAQVAREAGYREHVVRYALSSLLERSALQLALVVDEVKLGIHKYEALLSFSPPSIDALTSIEAELIKAPLLWWITKLSGPYDYYVSLCVTDESEIGLFFDSLREEFGSVFSKKSLAQYCGWAHFGSKQLLSKARPKTPVTTGFSGSGTVVDSVDLNLLATLTRTPLISSRELGHALGLPPSTVLYRMSRLRKLGVIQAPVFRLQAPAYLFYNKLIIKTSYPSQRLRKQLFAFARQHPCIVEAVFVIGDWDCVFRLQVQDPKQAATIAKELEIQFGSDLESTLLMAECGDLKWHGDPAQTVLSSLSKADAEIAPRKGLRSVR